MKEIKVRILSQRNVLDGPTEIRVEPICRMSDFLDACKTYKLVEDEPDGFVTASLKNNPLVNLSIDEKREFAKYLEHAPKMIFSTSDLPGFKGGKIPNKTITSTTYGVFGTRSGGKTVSQMGFDEYKPKKRVMFNGNATILEIGDFKTVVKCHDGDEFNEVIGLGLALSRYFAKQKSTKKELDTLKYYIPKYTDLAEYCVHKYFKYDYKRILNFFDKIEHGKWVELCLEK